MPHGAGDYIRGPAGDRVHEASPGMQEQIGEVALFRRCRVAVAVWGDDGRAGSGRGLGGCGDRSATMERPAVEGGLIQGVKTDGVWSYLGIPYAAPPWENHAETASAGGALEGRTQLQGLRALLPATCGHDCRGRSAWGI